VINLAVCSALSFAPSVSSRSSSYRTSCFPRNDTDTFAPVSADSRVCAVIRKSERERVPARDRSNLFSKSILVYVTPLTRVVLTFRKMESDVLIIRSMQPIASCEFFSSRHCVIRGACMYKRVYTRHKFERATALYARKILSMKAIARSGTSARYTFPVFLRV